MRYVMAREDEDNGGVPSSSSSSNNNSWRARMTHRTAAAAAAAATAAGGAPAAATAGGAGGGEAQARKDDDIHQACQTEIQALRAEVALLRDESGSLRSKLKEALGDVPACCICLEVVSYPVALQDCQHMYCCQCIYQLITSGSRVCPICRSLICKPPVPPPLAFIQHLERVE